MELLEEIILSPVLEIILSPVHIHPWGCMCVKKSELEAALPRGSPLGSDSSCEVCPVLTAMEVYKFSPMYSATAG